MGRIGDEFRVPVGKKIVPTLKGDVWRVCEGGYRVEGRGQHKYLVPAYDIGLESKWSTINLAEEQNYLLDFVAAYREGVTRCKDQPLDPSEFEKPIVEFVNRYGLGISGEFRWAGGPEETVQTYLDVMLYVEPIIHLLEALLSGDENAVVTSLNKSPDIKNCIATPDDFDLYWANRAEPNEHLDEPEMDTMEQALTGLGYVVSYWFHQHCLPFAILAYPARRLGQMDTGWGFSHHSGAVFWHLFQLIGAQGKIARCENCGTMIPNAHKNTRFCRNKNVCHSAHYYRSVTAPERAHRKFDTN